MDIKTVIGDYEAFLNKVFENLKKAGVEVGSYELDHIAYRATTLESFEKLSCELPNFGKMIHRIVIRNRFVDKYLLDEPINFGGRTIYLLEMLAPAEGDKFSEGLEHAEFVVKDMTLIEFIKKYCRLNWNTKGINREIDPEIAVYFDNGANVKFHTLPLKKVVKMEKLRE